MVHKLECCDTSAKSAMCVNSDDNLIKMSSSLTSNWMHKSRHKRLYANIKNNITIFIVQSFLAHPSPRRTYCVISYLNHKVGNVSLMMWSNNVTCV